MHERPGPAIPLLAPAHLLVLLVIGLPSIWLVWLGFTESSFGRLPRFVGWANYAHILADPYFWRALGNTALLVLLVVHVELLVALGLALLFAHGLPMRRVMLAIVLAPYAISEVAAVVMWRYLFDPDAGPVQMLLATLGLPALDWAVSPTQGLLLVALLSVWLHLPFSFMILYSARLAIPNELYEAARIDGAGPFQAFRRVTLPLLVPAILVSVLFRLIFAVRIFSEVWLLTGGGPARSTEVVAVYLYLEAFRYDAFGAAAATGWLMVAFALLAAAPYLVWMGRRADA